MESEIYLRKPHPDALNALKFYWNRLYFKCKRKRELPMTTTLPTPTNLEAKNLLAKLMATEDITVEHSPSAQTAMFDMEKRVLTLPVWKDLDTDTLDMLIGHEVSHALHTPAGREPLMSACEYIDKNHMMNAKDYLNVVEDARIERMIKTRFPGLRKSFVAGYRALLERDLFGLKKVSDISELPLVDRINLQYKIGWLKTIPFSAEELSLVQRVATTSSWDDVVKLSKEIYDLAKQQAKDQKDKEEEKEDEGSPDGAESEDDSDEESVPTDPTDGDDGDDSDDAEDNSMSKPTDTDDDSDENSEDSKSGEESEDNEDAEDSTEGGENTTDSDDNDAEEGEGEETASNESEKTKKNTEDDDAPAPKSKTQSSVEENLKNLIDKDAVHIVYADLPVIDEGYVVSLQDMRQTLTNWMSKDPRVAKVLPAVYASWKTNHMNSVQSLATEFDRRKAADAHKRTAVAETGSIDPNRLHAYRIAEDIFLQNAYVKDGKNHGLMLVLDMSGSMAAQFHDTMIQLVTLAHFCRRVNIPFTFYGFTDQAQNVGNNKPSFKAGSFNGNEIHTRLVTLLQDGMRTSEFVEVCSLLLLASTTAGGGIGNAHPTSQAVRDMYTAYGPPVAWMTLDNTPTNGALVGMPQLMSEFKKNKRVEIMNLIVLTDGESSDDLASHHAVNSNNAQNRRCPIVWRDPKSKKTYKMSKEAHYGTYAIGRIEQSEVLLKIIRDRVGGNQICIHLTNKSDAKILIPRYSPDQYDQVAIAAMLKKFATEGWANLKNSRGYVEYIMINSQPTNSDEHLVLTDVNDINDKKAINSLRKIFTAKMAAGRANRPLLTRVAELISK